MSELPECVQQWRGNYSRRAMEGFKGSVVGNCLEWLATAQEGTAIVAAGTGDAEVLEQGQRDALVTHSKFEECLVRATIIDRAALVEWLSTEPSWPDNQPPPHDSDWMRWFKHMPPDLRALIG